MTAKPEWLSAQTAKAREDERAARQQVEALELAAAHPALALLPNVRNVVRSGGALILISDIKTREAAAELFERMAAHALPVVAYRGTFAGVKPACDYSERDGRIELDSEYALPCAFDVKGYAHALGRAEERLRAFFETETDRVQVWLDIAKPAASFRREDIRDGRGRIVETRWIWSGLPNANTRFAYAPGDKGPNTYSFAFDTSTDLAAWLSPRCEEI